MLLIRKSQIEAFVRLAVADFEDRMVTHLRRVFPEACGTALEATLRKKIQHAIARAKRFGVTHEYDVCLYLHIMVAKGDHFDDAPEHVALRGLLEDQRMHISSRVDLLHDLVFGSEDAEAEEAREEARRAEEDNES